MFAIEIFKYPKYAKLIIKMSALVCFIFGIKV